MSAVIAGMENIATSEGYNLIISQSSESVEKEIANVNTLFNSRVDGLLVSLAYDTDSLAHFDSFIKKNIPLIFFDRTAEQRDCTCILINNLKAAYEATTHLISQGRRKIVHITATSNEMYISTACKDTNRRWPINTSPSGKTILLRATSARKPAPMPPPDPWNETAPGRRIRSQ